MKWIPFVLNYFKRSSWLFWKLIKVFQYWHKSTNNIQFSIESHSKNLKIGVFSALKHDWDKTN